MSVSTITTDEIKVRYTAGCAASARAAREFIGSRRPL
jgi:hypothetical protein